MQDAQARPAGNAAAATDPSGSARPCGRPFAGRTAFITGASRGIGLEIALHLARAGARIVVAAKTETPHPNLPGTIHSAAELIRDAGSECLPLALDIRDETAVAAGVARAREVFGGIDILVNNASAISLSPTDATPMKRFDLMHGVNARGTFACTQACLPLLRASAQAGRNPHVLTLSPPLSLDPRWFGPHVAYSLAKFGMSLCVLGHAAEFRPLGIAVNALWPRTAIETAAIRMLPGVRPEHCRHARIVAEAALAVLARPAADCSGNFFLDEDVLREAGVRDFDAYAVVPGSRALLPDLFI